MKPHFYSRRHILLGAGACSAAMATGTAGLIMPASASEKFAPTRTMRGGANNYSPNAPIVENLGTGFLMYGTVLKAGTGEPLPNVRIQIWAATGRGGEREPSNHGSVLTKADGSYQLEMSQIVPNFGQPHGHLAYDDSEFETVFLRPVMNSASDTSLQADFILAPA
ncbi:MAG: twin-arginine translocation pathway signal [Pseudomonadota bacterium]